MGIQRTRAALARVAVRLSELGRGSQELPEVIGCKPSVAHDSAHCEGVDWIVAWNRDDSGAVGHDDVFALARDAKPHLFERPHGIEIVDSGNAGHD